ncbi:hypothetical protein [Streptomyces sp. G7(2002)]|uniref:hypothetical protein n=1 Tax=Streptomyces sp. G7(2002) TaxID=2971798 RepID=UPI00237E837D|nr:hypothetical protein [Streptomyces sp. G7(2002)]WDT53508.1 hypothetical protein NUT86_05305 [Streptomyces sp. G7(2002)]
MAKRIAAALRRSTKVRRRVARSATAAASETVALVLDVSVRLPTSQADVEDLVERLQAHIVALSGLLAPEGLNSAPEKLRRLLVKAHELRRREVLQDDVRARIHLVHLADITQLLLVWAAVDEQAFAESAIDRPTPLDRSGVASRWAGLLWGNTSRGVKRVCHR